MTKREDMPVVIFVGGKGSRMSELTNGIPKPMVKIGEYPILWHLMKIYAHQGFNNFILTLGYKGEYFVNYIEKDPIGKKQFKDFNITMVDTGDEHTPHGGRLLMCKDYLKTDTFMCTYGDGLMNIDLNKLLAFHNNFKGIYATITAVYVPHRFGVITHTPEGKMLGYQKGHPMKDPINAGFMALNKKFLDVVNEQMMIEDPFDPLSKLGKQAVYIHDGVFTAIDSLRDYEVANKLWETDPPWKVWSD